MAFPIEEQYILAAEKELNLVFPSSFRNKMMIENGGDVFVENDNWQIFPFFDQSNQKRKIRTCNHILHETKIAKQWTGFPLHAIAIARNGCGDYLIFLPQKHDPHTLSDLVHIWFHGTNEIQLVDLDFKTLV
ncbi:SMI1/KNR4 family protein [Acinetobacter junii]|uniref:SMI1/KNR4 family protein n=1 Tax=Acinetobacter junii TaxID=40215 RepID=UPI00190237D4|nr:SMI1/KNR4 family protein [Acinetobacter junii]MBJ8440154.1 SMI1/KNR4 family protein [Acinetobacter junii]